MIPKSPPIAQSPVLKTDTAKAAVKAQRLTLPEAAGLEALAGKLPAGATQAQADAYVGTVVNTLEATSPNLAAEFPAIFREALAHAARAYAVIASTSADTKSPLDSLKADLDAVGLASADMPHRTFIVVDFLRAHHDLAGLRQLARQIGAEGDVDFSSKNAAALGLGSFVLRRGIDRKPGFWEALKATPLAAPLAPQRISLPLPKFDEGDSESARTTLATLDSSAQRGLAAAIGMDPDNLPQTRSAGARALLDFSEHRLLHPALTAVAAQQSPEQALLDARKRLGAELAAIPNGDVRALSDFLVAHFTDINELAFLDLQIGRDQQNRTPIRQYAQDLAAYAVRHSRADLLVKAIARELGISDVSSAAASVSPPLPSPPPQAPASPTPIGASAALGPAGLEPAKLAPAALERALEQELSQALSSGDVKELLFSSGLLDTSWVNSINLNGAKGRLISDLVFGLRSAPKEDLLKFTAGLSKARPKLDGLAQQLRTTGLRPLTDPPGPPDETPEEKGLREAVRQSPADGLAPKLEFSGDQLGDIDWDRGPGWVARDVVHALSRQHPQDWPADVFAKPQKLADAFSAASTAAFANRLPMRASVQHPELSGLSNDQRQLFLDLGSQLQTCPMDELVPLVRALSTEALWMVPTRNRASLVAALLTHLADPRHQADRAALVAGLPRLGTAKEVVDAARLIAQDNAPQTAPAPSAAAQRAPAATAAPAPPAAQASRPTAAAPAAQAPAPAPNAVAVPFTIAGSNGLKLAIDGQDFKLDKALSKGLSTSKPQEGILLLRLTSEKYNADYDFEALVIKVTHEGAFVTASGTDSSLEPLTTPRQLTKEEELVMREVFRRYNPVDYERQGLFESENLMAATQRFLGLQPVEGLAQQPSFTMGPGAAASTQKLDEDLAAAREKANAAPETALRADMLAKNIKPLTQKVGNKIELTPWSDLGKKTGPQQLVELLTQASWLPEFQEASRPPRADAPAEVKAAHAAKEMADREAGKARHQILGALVANFSGSINRGQPNDKVLEQLIRLAANHSTERFRELLTTIETLNREKGGDPQLTTAVNLWLQHINLQLGLETTG